MKKKILLDLVVDICNRYPRAANDDNVLLEQVWLHEGFDYNKSLYENICRLPRPESITRRRRHAHAAGLIKYSEEADKEREQAFLNERNDMGQPRAISWMND